MKKLSLNMKSSSIRYINVKMHRLWNQGGGGEGGGAGGLDPSLSEVGPGPKIIHVSINILLYKCYI